MSDQLPVYRVTVSREDGLWVAVVDGLPGGATDVERFEDLHDAVHEVLAAAGLSQVHGDGKLMRQARSLDANDT